jgi:type IV fimbrial biogenesis protein FimT
MSHRTLRSAGFTLVELLAVILIAAILMGIGVPSYRSVTTSSRVATEINTLLFDLQFARAQALKEGESVTACPSTDGESCADSSSWQSGWIVFSDPNGDAVVDDGETVWRSQKAFSGHDTLEAADDLSSVTFNRAGLALNLPDAGTVLTLHDRNSNAVFTRCLSITTAGMMTTQTNASSPGTCS